MSTLKTQCLKVTINAPFSVVANDLAQPETHPEWGTEFFDGPLKNNDDGSYSGQSKFMGGAFRYKVESNKDYGIFDLYLAPEGQGLGHALPVRLVKNYEGVDVIWVMAQMPDMPDQAFEQSCESLRRELKNLKARHEK